MALLGVNIDHVATIREARKTNEPDPVWAASLAELGGADCITVHLREDRRHIQERDLRLLKETTRVKLNLEMAIAEEIVSIAIDTRPEQVTPAGEDRHSAQRAISGRHPRGSIALSRSLGRPPGCASQMAR